jgi:hypothetical protein
MQALETLAAGAAASMHVTGMGSFCCAQALATGDDGATVDKFLAVDPTALSMDLITL